MTLGDRLVTLQTWLPYAHINVLSQFNTLKKLRLVLMAREEDTWGHPINVLTTGSSRLFLPNVPEENIIDFEWSQNKIESVEIFFEIDSPLSIGPSDITDINPLLRSLARRFGPKGASELKIGVFPGCVTINEGVTQILQNCSSLKVLQLYGGTQRHPVMNLNLLEQVPPCLSILRLHGILLVDGDDVIATAEEAKRRLGMDTSYDLDIQLQKWKHGFEEFHRMGWDAL